jgi:prepilin-type N-terminal cleavage/methylation domain-containing protein
MQRVKTARVTSGKKRHSSFTLVELLTVIAIIGILVAITLQAASGVMAKAARSRASSEIQAISAALESYKNDNGAYPQAFGLLTNTAASPYTSLTIDGSTTAYQTNSAVIYQALTGMTNFGNTPITGTKTYMAFKSGQLGNFSSSASSPVYIQDPWGYSYGYSTGTTNGAPTPSYPYTGSGFFDLWSTGGLLAPSATNSTAWLANWQ